MKVTVIGGGTGTISVLGGLKQYKDIDLSVIVNMTDDGGSNSIVRDEFGLLPLSDLRKSIIALAEGNPDSTLRKLFTYRFDKGDGLVGHTVGNLIMMALSDITGSELGAIHEASQLFHLKGKVIPVTMSDTRLVAEYDNGDQLFGEHIIDENEKYDNHNIRKLRLDRKADANPEALESIENADFIIIGPGDLYTSTLPNIVVDGIAPAIKKSKSRIVFISNLMSKKGQTRGFCASDFVNTISSYLGKTPDYVLLNNSSIPSEILKRYTSDGEHLISDDLEKNDAYRIVRTDLIESTGVKIEKGDQLKRSLIRHSPDKLGKVLYSLMQVNFINEFLNIVD